jgi:hypothetical protein
MPRGSFQKRLKHLGVIAAVVLGLLSPLAGASSPAQAAASIGSITNSPMTSTGLPVTC